MENGNFISWPGLTSKLISKHLPLSLPTLKVHLKQYHQNITSTKKIATIEKTEAEASPTQESKTQYCLLLWHQRKPKQCTQTSLEDIQFFWVAATSTFSFATIMKLISYRQHPPITTMLQKYRTLQCLCLVPDKGAWFFYTRSNLSALQNCALFPQPLFSLVTHLNISLHNLVIGMCSTQNIF